MSLRRPNVTYIRKLCRTHITVIASSIMNAPSILSTAVIVLSLRGRNERDEIEQHTKQMAGLRLQKEVARARRYRKQISASLAVGCGRAASRAPSAMNSRRGIIPVKSGTRAKKRVGAVADHICCSVQRAACVTSTVSGDDVTSFARVHMAPCKLCDQQGEAGQASSLM